MKKNGFFCCFQLGKKGFRGLRVSLRVFFGAVKLMKFQSPFTLGFPYDIAYLVFFKSSQVFANHGFASVLNRETHFICIKQACQKNLQLLLNPNKVIEYSQRVNLYSDNSDLRLIRLYLRRPDLATTKVIGHHSSFVFIHYSYHFIQSLAIRIRRIQQYFRSLRELLKNQVSPVAAYISKRVVLH